MEPVAILLLAAVATLILAVISYGLHFFVALKSPPSKRAAWTAGSAYLVTTSFAIFGGVPGYELIAPAAVIPGALIAFWYWRAEFRDQWIQNPDIGPDGITLANDDWRIGLLRLLLIIAVAAITVLLRRYLKGD